MIHMKVDLIKGGTLCVDGTESVFGTYVPAFSAFTGEELQPRPVFHTLRHTVHQEV